MYVCKQTKKYVSIYFQKKMHNTLGIPFFQKYLCEMSKKQFTCCFLTPASYTKQKATSIQRLTYQLLAPLIASPPPRYMRLLNTKLNVSLAFKYKHPSAIL